MTNVVEVLMPDEQNAYRQCNYQPYEQCIWDRGVLCCDRCPLNVESTWYSFAPRPVVLRYELVCFSPHCYESDCDCYHAELLGDPNWSTKFRCIYMHFQAWLRNNLGRKRVDSKYEAALDMVLANCLVAANSNSQLLVSKKTESSVRRNPQDIGYKLVQHVLNYLSECNFLYRMNGVANSSVGGASWYVPSQQLITILSENHVDHALHKDTLFLDYKERDKERDKEQRKWKAVRLPENLLEPAYLLQLPAQLFAKQWEGHTATLRGKSLSPCLWRVFNGSLDAGGRFYGTYQNMKREDRLEILIDEEKTIEPDFDAFHIYLLYALAGIQCCGDPYEIEGFERATIKSVFLRMLNHPDRGCFIRQITRSGNVKIKNEWKSYEQAKVRNLSLGIQPPNKRNRLKGFIENIPDSQDGSELLSAVVSTHPDISEHFFTSGLGLHLQFLDSQIMANIISELVDREIPTLPIHDSIRCKVSDQAEVIEIMGAIYYQATGFNCLIS